MRRARDFYETAAWQSRALLAHVPEIGGRVVECCAGNLSIARVLSVEGGLSVVTNDPDRRWRTNLHLSAARARFWRELGSVDWVITNPPYRGDLLLAIARLAVEHARGGVALLLRLSFKEPTAKGQPVKRLASGLHVPANPPRGPWLERHPIARELVLPRYSFTCDGRSDSVTTAWMVWARGPLSGRPHVSVYDAERRYVEPWRRAA